MKSLSLTDQIPWQRRKLVSGFGLGVLASTLFFAVLLLSHFLKSPSLSTAPMFQGLLSVPSTNFSLQPQYSEISDRAQKKNLAGPVGDGGAGGGGGTEGQTGNFTSDEECDIFDGTWVRDEDSEPYYPGGSCPYIDRDFDCGLNKRPDDGYLRWKWKPNGCDIPRLNGSDFLEMLRGKKLVFVGDSLNRNMWESLVCVLRHSVEDKKRVYEISGKTEFKKKGFYAFMFEDYDCTIDFVSSPFLVRESSFRRNNESIDTLRIDLMDQTTSMYHDADIIIFNTGHWWTHEKTSRGKDYYQEGDYVHPRLKALEAFKRALKTWSNWVDQNIDSNRTRVFFRGFSITHFRGGPWNSGGQCHKETEPFFNTTYLPKYPSKMRAFEAVIREMKTPMIYLNISRLTGYRKDGHPSIYRTEYKSIEEQIAAVRSQDCSHWCLLAWSTRYLEPIVVYFFIENHPGFSEKLKFI